MWKKMCKFRVKKFHSTDNRYQHCKFLSTDNRYQHRKALLRRRQVMFGNGTELTSLRVVSDSMMTEFNPNYEYDGNLYSFKDLPQIPRDNIFLVK